MRILQVHTRYRQPGGEDAVIETERQLLKDAGHVVDRSLLDNPHGLGPSLAALAKAAWNSKAAAKVLDTSQRFRPDVIHVHNTWFALSPAVFPTLKAEGYPVVTTIHNYRLACVNALLYRDERPCMDCVGRLPWPGVLHRCYRGSAIQSGVVAVTIANHRRRGTWEHDVDRIIVLSRFAADILVRSGIQESRIVVKPNVVKDPGPRTCLPSEGDSILYVGRLAPEKGILDLLSAWRKADLPGLELLVIGDGPLLDEVRAAAGAGVNVMGRVPSDGVRRLMLGARALVLPSRWYEGMPMTLLEAMAAGLPVVVPDHGDLVEIAGSGGVPYQALGVESLANTLELLADGDLSDRRGQLSRAAYLDRFMPVGGVARLEEIYAEAVGGRD